MDEIVLCPGCQSHLALPSLPEGQTVQCPRCQHVFEPFRQRAAAPPVAVAVAVPVADTPADFSSLTGASLYPREPLRGRWTAVVAMNFLVGNLFALAALIHVHHEQRQLRQEQMQLIQREEREAQKRLRDGEQRIEEALWQRWNLWQEHWRDCENFERKMRMLNLLLFYAAAVVVLVWLHQAARNVRLMRVASVSCTPAWAVGSFILPVANLYCPYVVMQEIWQTSNPRAIENAGAWRRTPGSWLIRFWWCFYVAALLLGFCNTLYALDGNLDLPTERMLLLSGCVSDGLMMIAGGLLIAVIAALTQRQRQRQRNLLKSALLDDAEEASPFPSDVQSL